MAPSQPFTNPATTDLARAWLAAQPNPATALRNAREGMTQVGRGASFAHALARFEAAVRADARADVHAELADRNTEIGRLRAVVNQRVDRYDDIIKADRATPSVPAGLIPTHVLGFFSPRSVDGGSELLGYDVVGMLPIPAVGGIVTLHETYVRVLSVSTTYSNDETTGHPRIYTFVTVRTLNPGERPEEL